MTKGKNLRALARTYAIEISVIHTFPSFQIPLMNRICPYVAWQSTRLRFLPNADWTCDGDRSSDRESILFVGVGISQTVEMSVGYFCQMFVLIFSINLELILENFSHRHARHPPVGIVGFGEKSGILRRVNLFELVSFLSFAILQGSGLFLFLHKPSDLRF